MAEEQQEYEQVTYQELVERIKKIDVGELIVSTCSTLAQLGYAKLERSSRDLEQARLAIEALRALVPVIEAGPGPEVARDFRQVVANLQLSYTDAAGPGGER